MTHIIIGRGGARERLLERNVAVVARATIARDAAPKRKPGRAIRPNEGIAAEYRSKLDALIREMAQSVVYWIKARYKANAPEMAQDAPPDAGGQGLGLLPATELEQAIRELTERWQTKFDEIAPKLAAYFATDVQKRSDAALKRILLDHGVTVKFKPTRAQRDVMKATVEQNVRLIKSIPQHYLNEVQGIVMRSVQTGRDLGKLTQDLQKQYGVTRRRAALIARDQNNRATSAMSHVRQADLGITEAVWMHSHAGKEPRPSHVAMNGKRYEIAKGMWDPHEKEFVFPGQLVNCRCVSRPVLPGGF